MWQDREQVVCIVCVWWSNLAIICANLFNHIANCTNKTYKWQILFQTLFILRLKKWSGFWVVTIRNMITIPLFKRITYPKHWYSLNIHTYMCKNHLPLYIHVLFHPGKYSSTIHTHQITALHWYQFVQKNHSQFHLAPDENRSFERLPLQTPFTYCLHVTTCLLCLILHRSILQPGISIALCL